MSKSVNSLGRFPPQHEEAIRSLVSRDPSLAFTEDEVLDACGVQGSPEHRDVVGNSVRNALAHLLTIGAVRELVDGTTRYYAATSAAAARE